MRDETPTRVSDGRIIISGCQTLGKPDSVLHPYGRSDGHLSGTHVAIRLERFVRLNLRAAALAGRSSTLAADGVYLPCRSPGSAIPSYGNRFTLTP